MLLNHILIYFLKENNLGLNGFQGLHEPFDLANKNLCEFIYILIGRINHTNRFAKSLGPERSRRQTMLEL